jgi:hypothetical protein
MRFSAGATPAAGQHEADRPGGEQQAADVGDEAGERPGDRQRSVTAATTLAGRVRYERRKRSTRRRFEAAA